MLYDLGLYLEVTKSMYQMEDRERLLRKYVKKLIESIRSKRRPIVRWKNSPSFSLDVFKTLPNESIMLAYAENYLDEIGRGSSRGVFVLTSKKVLKVALNPKGLAQNRAEVQVYTDPATADTAAAIHDADEEGRWLISDVVRPLSSEEEFRKLTGVEWSDFVVDLEATLSSTARATWGHADMRKDAQPFTKAVYKMAEMGSSRLKVGDLTELGHWGKTPDGRVVILDYGFTEDVATKHYSRSPSPRTQSIPPTAPTARKPSDPDKTGR